jgi:hypothetical protein
VRSKGPRKVESMSGMRFEERGLNEHWRLLAGGSSHQP